MTDSTRAKIETLFASRIKRFANYCVGQNLNGAGDTVRKELYKDNRQAAYIDHFNGYINAFLDFGFITEEEYKELSASFGKELEAARGK